MRPAYHRSILTYGCDNAGQLPRGLLPYKPLPFYGMSPICSNGAADKVSAYDDITLTDIRRLDERRIRVIHDRQLSAFAAGLSWQTVLVASHERQGKSGIATPAYAARPALRQSLFA